MTSPKVNRICHDNNNNNNNNNNNYNNDNDDEDDDDDKNNFISIYRSYPLLKALYNHIKHC